MMSIFRTGCAVRARALAGAFLVAAGCVAASHAVAAARLPAPLPTQRETPSVAKVTGIADGDTLYVRLDGKSRRMRLLGIDAPEKKQAFGNRAEKSLRELVWKRDVRVQWTEIDRYGRPLVRLSVDGVDVNAEQVRRGYAWVYRAYSHDPELLRLEAQARAARRGLWSTASPTPPWDWRHERDPHQAADDDWPRKVRRSRPLESRAAWRPSL